MKKVKKIITACLLALSIPVASTVTACNGKKDDPIVEDITWSFTAKNGTGYEIQVNTPGVTLNNGVAEVKDGTAINFTISLLEGYQQSTYTVKANGVALTKNVDGSYLVNVTGNTTITVEGVTKDVQYFDVTFQEGEGYSYSDISVALTSGKANVASVKEGDTVTFKVNVSEGYDGSEMLVKANNNVLNLKDGVYSFTVSGATVVSVSDVSKEASKFTVTLTAGTGFSYIDTSDTVEDGVMTVNDGTEIYFGLQADEGYTLENAVVKAGDTVIAADEEDGHYYVTITANTVITVTGVAAETFDVTFYDTDAYSFSDISGIALTEGAGQAEAGTEISFKININEGYEVTDLFAVKADTEVLLADDGVYSFVVKGDTAVTISGVLKGEEVVSNAIVQKAGTESTDICTQKGYTKSTEILGIWTGSWANYERLPEIELARYDVLRFAVKCDGKNYFEFKTEDGADTSSCATNSANWTEYFFVREDHTPEGATKQEFVYRLYKDKATTEGWTAFFLEEDAFLSDWRILLGGDPGSEGHFIFTELRGRENPNYVAPNKDITFVLDENPHYTVNIEGQSTSNCVAPFGQEFTFTVTPEEGYLVNVLLNGNPVDETAPNTYTMVVERDNVVEIKECVLVGNTVLNGASYNDETQTSSLTLSWGQTKAFVAVENINQYSSVYFSVKFSKNGWCVFGPAATTKAGIWGFTADAWYNVTLTKLDTDKFVITVSPTMKDFPTQGYEMTLTNGNLSEFGMEFQDNSGSSCTGTFTRLFGKLA